MWADTLGIPILSVNYRKAPENPYPAGFNDCFDVYELLVTTQGQCIGANMPPVPPGKAPVPALVSGMQTPMHPLQVLLWRQSVSVYSLVTDRCAIGGAGGRLSRRELGGRSNNPRH